MKPLHEKKKKKKITQCVWCVLIYLMQLLSTEAVLNIYRYESIRIWRSHCCDSKHIPNTSNRWAESQNSHRTTTKTMLGHRWGDFQAKYSLRQKNQTPSIHHNQKPITPFSHIHSENSSISQANQSTQLSGIIHPLHHLHQELHPSSSSTQQELHPSSSSTQ